MLSTMLAGLSSCVCIFSCGELLRPAKYGLLPALCQGKGQGWGGSFDELVSSLALASALSGLEGGIVGRVGPRALLASLAEVGIQSWC